MSATEIHEHVHLGWSINADRPMLVSHLMSGHDILAVECPDPVALHLELHGIPDEDVDLR